MKTILFLIVALLLISLVLTLTVNYIANILFRLPLKQPKVYYISSNWLPVFRAIMIPHVGIFIKKEYKKDLILLKHETVHWKQYKRMGSIIFLLRYLFQFLFIGYDSMPMELEARQYDKSLWNYRERWWK